MDPPPENGIAINFGTSHTGSGKTQPNQPVKSEPIPQPKEIVEQTSEDVVPQEQVENQEVLTQESENSPVVTPPKKEQQADESIPVKEKPKEKKPIEEVKPKKPSKETQNVLDNLLNGTKSDGETTQGHGEDQSSGDKGEIDGSVYANSFYGDGKGKDLGSGLSAGLNGRKLMGNNKIQQQCNEVGRIVVIVRVNQKGQVIHASYSAKGSTSTSKCLVDPALRMAKTFRWQPDQNAPKIQIGYIVINFSLGE